MNINQVGFQLYTCHNLLKGSAEIAQTFKRLHTIGYTAVETYGTSVSDEELGKILREEGFTCVSAHQNPKDILNTPEIVAENLQKLGCKLVANPAPGGIDLGSISAVQSFIENLQRSGEALRKTGNTLCYHNHHFEFRKLDGKIILERIYDGTSRDALQGELDTYWVQYGGGDIYEWCEKLAGRLPIIHLKDYEINAKNTPQFCEIGSGTMNIPKIIAAAEKSGCQWLIVEQDTCPGDPVDSLEQSFRALQKIL